MPLRGNKAERSMKTSLQSIFNGHFAQYHGEHRLPLRALRAASCISNCGTARLRPAAPPGRHHRQCRLVGHEVRDHGLLAIAQALQAEGAPQQRGQARAPRGDRGSALPEWGRHGS
jgi:hypothetical protein